MLFEIEIILNKMVSNNIAYVNKNSDTQIRPKTKPVASRPMPDWPRTRKPPFGSKGFSKVPPLCKKNKG